MRRKDDVSGNAIIGVVLLFALVIVISIIITKAIVYSDMPLWLKVILLK